MDDSRTVEFAEAAGLSFFGPAPVINGHDPVYRYPVPIAEASATAHALCADAALALWRLRGAKPGAIEIDVERAAAFLAGASIQWLEGTPSRPEQWEPGDAPGIYRPWGSMQVLRGENATNPVVGLYQGRNGRWIHLHGGAPHLGERILAVLGCEQSAEAIAAAILAWDELELEQALSDAETCGAVARTVAEWADHPQGRSVNALGTVSIDEVSGADAWLPRTDAIMPLAGVRVLDLGDGLAGPLCARTLARYGADVLQVVSPERSFVEPFVLDTGFGKRSTSLDLRRPGDAVVFSDLLATADVLCDSFRPGALDALGFAPATCREINPGLVITSISCYGAVGPWRERRGWEQLGQVATGLSLATSKDGKPRLAPATLCDCTTGLLGAVGTIRALSARLQQGGGWNVAVSLCQTASWLERLGSSVPEESAPPVPDFRALLEPNETHVGRLWHLGPVVELGDSMFAWPAPPPKRGGDAPRWLAAS